MKILEKTTRPFRYNLNQITYDYTVAMRNRFKGLDLIDRVPDEPWTEVHDIVQEAVIKTIPKTTPVFLPGESQGWGSLVGCHIWGHTESDMAEET